jgi:hypothetical protein
MVITSRFVGSVLVLAFGLLGCSTDIYRAQSDLLQMHAKRFQSFLHREQVDAAMHENHAIELIGMQLKGGRLPGSDRLKPADFERQAYLLDAVREQSAAELGGHGAILLNPTTVRSRQRAVSTGNPVVRKRR